MHELAAALIVAIPITFLATLFRLLGVEYALGIVWAVMLLLSALGVSMAAGLVKADDTSR